MKIKRDSEKYYRNTSFPVACFLFAKDQQISGVNSTNDSSKKEFVFVRTDYLDELVERYKFGDKNDSELLVNTHKYEQARRELLDLLNDAKRHE